mmetsp:Transcript_101421/g.180315  ORF Transcript_101421/g.180315 Transcript_101421/m.180315 type:complete len:81 (+) Transcript_101421:28-270(+)
MKCTSGSGFNVTIHRFGSNFWSLELQVRVSFKSTGGSVYLDLHPCELTSSVMVFIMFLRMDSDRLKGPSTTSWKFSLSLR